MPRTASPDRGGASDKQQGGPHALHLTLRNTHRPDAKSMQVLRRHAKPTIGATGRSRAHHQQEGQRAPQKKKQTKKKPGHRGRGPPGAGARTASRKASRPSYSVHSGTRASSSSP